MPDPVLCLWGMCAAACASAIVVLVSGRLPRSGVSGRMDLAGVIGIAVGLLAGYVVLGFRPGWPPTNALGRFLLLLLPAAVAVELLAGLARGRWRSVAGQGLVWSLRLTLAAVASRILLHGSVYLNESAGGWTAGQGITVLAIAGVLLAGVWGLLARLAERSPGVTVPLALSQALLCAGATILLAGYISGGEAALPPAAALAGVAIGGCLQGRMSNSVEFCRLPGAVGVGVLSLFSLLLIGRFFGDLSTSQGLVILLAPLLCWSTELPLLRRCPPWLRGVVRLALVAIPLALVLVAAKAKFDREMAPLLGASPVQSFSGRLSCIAPSCTLILDPSPIEGEGRSSVGHASLALL